MVVDLYVPKAEPEVRIPADVPIGAGLLVCLVSRAANDKLGGWIAHYGTGEAKRRYSGQAYHTRCSSLVAKHSVNKRLSVRSFGMDGRRDLIRRITLSLL